MECRLRPLGFMDVFTLILYNSSIIDIGHFPYYIGLRSAQTHKDIW